MTNSISITENILILNGDCREILHKNNLLSVDNAIIVSDPPFNVGYHYNEYVDKMDENEYYNMLEEIFSSHPSVVIHYPESLYKLSIRMNKAPTRVVSWVYNSNTPRQHRDIAFFDCTPDFSKIKQPYKNPTDKRIQERMANGLQGGNIYDWWEINQVKNVSKDKTLHPCQMPLKVMLNIVGILPVDATIIDPFMGSGTTGMACSLLGRKFIGIERDKKYFDICEQRLSGKIVIEEDAEDEDKIKLW